MLPALKSWTYFKVKPESDVAGLWPDGSAAVCVPLCSMTPLPAALDCADAEGVTWVGLAVARFALLALTEAAALGEVAGLDAVVRPTMTGGRGLGSDPLVLT